MGVQALLRAITSGLRMEETGKNCPSPSFSLKRIWLHTSLLLPEHLASNHPECNFDKDPPRSLKELVSKSFDIFPWLISTGKSPASPWKELVQIFSTPATVAVTRGTGSQITPNWALTGLSIHEFTGITQNSKVVLFGFISASRDNIPMTQQSE